LTNIVHKLDKLREAAGLEKKELAVKIGSSRENVYNWRDENIKVSTFLKVCKVLHTDPRTFFDDFTEKTVNEPKISYTKTVKNCDEIIIERDLLREQNAVHVTSIKALTVAIETMQLQLKKAAKAK
jgi:DNA-binding Xre family transcriptional regulator